MRLAWDGSRWVRGGTLELSASPDAFWQEVGSPLDVAAGPRGTVIAGTKSFVWSTDGLHFTEAARRPVVADRAVDDQWTGPVLATQDGFVALTPAGIGGDLESIEPTVWFSADGSTWDLAGSTSPFGEGASVYDVASRNGRHVAVGSVGAPGGSPVGAIWVSDDGLAWERLPAPERAAPCVEGTALELGRDRGTPGSLVQASDGCELVLSRVAASESGWMILSKSELGGPWDGAAWTSSDGRTWEPLPGWPNVTAAWDTPNLQLGPGTIVAPGLLDDPTRPIVVVGTIAP